MSRAAALVMVLAGAAAASPADPVAHAIYKELVEIDTSQATGDSHRAAEAMAKRLRDAGFAAADVQVFEPAPHRGDVVARLHGTGKKKPLLLVAHIDVVEARREDWSTDPFQLVEKDGWFYGRGTGDDKFMASAWVANFVRWKREGYKPDRDLVLVLETDEEIGDKNELGIRWLIKHHRDLIDAEYALNEGGGVAEANGKPLWNSIQTAEKQYATYTLEVRNKGGHSSQPRQDNAIYQLAAALDRLAKLEFPLALNDTTRGYFAKMASIETGQLAADMKSVASAKPDSAAISRLSALPPYNAQLRTTCVATRLDAGHADNALPQLARATVNCRIVPGSDAAATQHALETAVADPEVHVALVQDDGASSISPINRELLAAIDRLTPKFWKSTPVIPTMSAGATDGRYLRAAGIPTYGHSGLAGDIFDVRAHGKDERVAVKAFDDGVEYLYELVKAVAGGR